MTTQGTTIGVAIAVPDPWGARLQDYRTALGDTSAVGIPTHITLMPPFETGGDEAFDKVIVVSASPNLQRQRVLSRPGMTQEKFEQILDRQMPDEEKRKRADFIVDTSGTMDETRDQVRNILTCLGLPTGV